MQSRTKSLPTLQMQQAWSDCKQAYDDAVFFTSVSRGWAEHVTRPWREALSVKTIEFKSTYGFEFDPNRPIVCEPYEALEEAIDFDASVDALTSHMREGA